LESIAYDPLGNRIFIALSDVTLYNPANATATTNDGLGNLLSTPKSSGVINIPVTQSSQNYIWINYLATVDTSAFTLNEMTNAKIFYKQTDGYYITVTTVNVPPNANSIFLAAVNMTAGGAVSFSQISQVGRQYYAILPKIVPIITPLADLSDRTPLYPPATRLVLEDHIKAVGTGPGISPFNPHNMSLADLGVTALDTVIGRSQLTGSNTIVAGIVGNAFPSTSAMATSIAIVNPGSDYIVVRQLLSSEAIIVNGAAFSNTDVFGAVPTDAHVFFPAVSGIYNVYWDSVTRSFAVTTASIASDVTKLWIATVTYTFVGLGPFDHNSLSALIDRRQVGNPNDQFQIWLTTGRPSNPLTGTFGFNMDINAPEFFDGVAWQSLGTLTGALVDFAGATVPTGYFLCDGSAVSRTTFSNLFTVIGTIWGIGDGSTTFNIPNFQRRTAVGSGGSGTGTLGNTVGNVGGAETHTLITAEIPALSVSDPGHIHGVVNNSDNGPAQVGKTQASIAGAGPGNFLPVANATPCVAVIQNHTTGISVGGGGGAHNNIQPSAIVTKIIKY
jgi:microcystin-dependent protein